jgi:hypothetical protein
MTTPVGGTELVEPSGCALAFERTDDRAQDNCERIAPGEVDVVFVASKLDNLAVGVESNLPKSLVKEISPLVIKRAPSIRGAKDNVHSGVAQESEGLRSALWVEPFLGIEVEQCA